MAKHFGLKADPVEVITIMPGEKRVLRKLLGVLFRRTWSIVRGKTRALLGFRFR